MARGPNPRDTFRNWADYEGSLIEKLALTFRNNTKKVATLSNCCGHPGEPGC